MSVSQTWPVYPAMHVQVNNPSSEVHVPWFLHGDFKQGSTSTVKEYCIIVDKMMHER